MFEEKAAKEIYGLHHCCFQTASDNAAQVLSYVVILLCPDCPCPFGTVGPHSYGHLRMRGLGESAPVKHTYETCLTAVSVSVVRTYRRCTLSPERDNECLNKIYITSTPPIWTLPMLLNLSTSSNTMGSTRKNRKGAGSWTRDTIVKPFTVLFPNLPQPTYYFIQHKSQACSIRRYASCLP